MASAFAGLLSQNRGFRPDSNSKGDDSTIKEISLPSDPRLYPGSLHRHQRSIPSSATYRSMLIVEDAPALSPLAISQEESMEDWVTEKLSQTSQKHNTRSNDWADILCFYTATNGAPSTAPSRASPVPNGKPASPEVPQSVTSADPKVAAQQANDMRNIVRRKLTGYVGFANLPNQWHRKSVRKGFNFNVMVVGKSRNRKQIG